MSAPDDVLRTEKPERTITVSTHIDLSEWQHWKDRAAYEKLEQDWTNRLVDVVATAFPAWDRESSLLLPGGPGAWVKYTKRPHGAVGGYAQTPSQALFRAASYAELLCVRGYCISGSRDNWRDDERITCRPGTRGDD